MLWGRRSTWLWTAPLAITMEISSIPSITAIFPVLWPEMGKSRIPTSWALPNRLRSSTGRSSVPFTEETIVRISWWLHPLAPYTTKVKLQKQFSFRSSISTPGSFPALRNPAACCRIKSSMDSGNFSWCLRLIPNAGACQRDISKPEKQMCKQHCGSYKRKPA